jgi:tRNA(Ile)-lysidine synthase
MDRSTSALRHILSKVLEPYVSAYSSGDTHDRRLRVAIALSGGLDSAALLHMATAHAAENEIDLYAFHIHHGLSENADAWLSHNEAMCQRMGVRFEARRVVLENLGKTGIEEAARTGRYFALGDMCRAYGIRLLLTAHHQDDQAETVLLQLLRGAGMAGLSGMAQSHSAPAILGNPDVTMLRPLLPATRRQLVAYVETHHIDYVNDESNTDPRFARNLLRYQVMPVLETAFPGFKERFSRSAQHAQSAQRLLVELAVQDLSACMMGEALDIEAVRGLSDDRSDNLLRHWFSLRAVRMPSTAWLVELRAQLLDSRPESRILISQPEYHVKGDHGKLFFAHGPAPTEKIRSSGKRVQPQQFVWSGESHINFPSYNGVLHFDVAEMGVSAAWLRRQDLSIHARQGGERFKQSINRPSKILKAYYQEACIPAHAREFLPIVSAGGELLYAAGIGMDANRISTHEDARISFRWAPDNV